MKHIENLVRQLLNLEYTYEHMGHNGIVERLVKNSGTPTGYVYFKADDLMPILQAMEKDVNE